MGVNRVTEIPKLAVRARDAHKGQFGRVLVVGGSRGMVGAAALAANAALRSGAGLVTLAVPACIHPAAASLAWCATSMALPCDEEAGVLSDDAGSRLRDIVIGEGRFDVVAVGPGIGRASGVVDLISALVAGGVATVIDADALNRLSEVGWDGLLAGRCVITPHPGEMARLLGRSTEAVQGDRAGAASEAVTRMAGGDVSGQAVCVLKGAGTIVTDGRREYVNQTGNPGMATGGSGDVLTGTVAALIGQGLACFDAAVLGVYVHGLAGDLSAEQVGEICVTAEDVLEALPAAFKRL